MAVIFYLPLSLVTSREEGPSVDYVGGLCSTFQILKSHWRKGPLLVGMVVWSYCEEASKVEKLRNLLV